MNEDSNEDNILRDMLEIEKHEDRMITAIVHLMASSERLNKRLGVLTWVMLILTWITFVISIPNTLATVFGIPKVSQILGVEVMITILIVATIGALLVLVLPNSALSITNLAKRLGTTVSATEPTVSEKTTTGRLARPERKKTSIE